MKKKESVGFTKKKKVTLVEYVKKMQSITYIITLTYLHLKVAKITLERLTHFKNGIHGWGWLRWFKQ
jgi:predicted ABC-type ATPase